MQTEVERRRVYAREWARKHREDPSVTARERAADRKRRSDPEARARELERARVHDAKRRATSAYKQRQRIYQREYQRERRRADDVYRVKQYAASKRWREANPTLVRLIKNRRAARLAGARSNGVGLHEWQEICAWHANKAGETMCAYCKKARANTIEHVVPIARGGRDEASNVLPACRTCNSSKGASLIWEWCRARELLTDAELEALSAQTRAHLGADERQAS